MNENFPDIVRYELSDWAGPRLHSDTDWQMGREGGGGGGGGCERWRRGSSDVCDGMLVSKGESVL